MAGLWGLAKPAAAAVREIGMKRPGGGAPGIVGCCMVAGGSDIIFPRVPREVVGMACPAPRGMGRGLMIPLTSSSRRGFFMAGAEGASLLLSSSLSFLGAIGKNLAAPGGKVGGREGLAGREWEELTACGRLGK